jgi:hypothetical protein
MVAAARKRAIPGIWFYSRTTSTGPKLPRDWHAAYVKAGGIAEFHMLPPYGVDGHDIISVGYLQWRPLLDRFLVSVGFEPRKPPADAPPATGFASLTDVPTVPLISQRCREIYTDFLKGDVPRASPSAPRANAAISPPPGVVTKTPRA